MTYSNGTAAAPDPEAAAVAETLTLKAAALRLGINEKTLKARIERGEIYAKKVQGKFAQEWRVCLPSGGAPAPLLGKQLPPLDEEAAPVAAEAAVEAPPPVVDLYRELLQRHEAATVRLGYLQAQNEGMKALQSTAAELQEKAAAAEERARQVDDERRRIEEERRQAEARTNEEHEARRKAEQEAEGLRRELGATAAALEAERGKGFWVRLFGR